MLSKGIPVSEDPVIFRNNPRIIEEALLARDSGAAEINRYSGQGGGVTPHSAWAEENQQGAHSKNDHNNR